MTVAHDVHYIQVPKREECLILLEKCGVKGALFKHSLRVNDVAVFIAKKLVENQELVDLQVVDRGSLLHDIGKPLVQGDEDHSAKGAELLFKMDFPKLANVVLKHSLSFILNNKFNSWEELIVYYADKRVEEDKIVSIHERLDSWKHKYPDSAELIEEVRPNLEELERQLFAHLKFTPAELGFKVEKSYVDPYAHNFLS